MYYMKRLNDMKYMNDNKVNIISEYNLLSDILNTFKWTKNIIIHYYPILHGCMNTRRGRAKYRIFWILLDSWCISTTVIIRLTKFKYSKGMYWIGIVRFYFIHKQIEKTRQFINFCTSPALENPTSRKLVIMILNNAQNVKKGYYHLRYCRKYHRIHSV